MTPEVDRILDTIQKASTKGPVPPELYVELRSSLLRHSEGLEDPTAAASLRLIADTLPIFRQWMDIEQQRQTPATAMLDAICNAVATLVFNAADAISSRGTVTQNSQALLGRINRAVISTAKLSDMEPTSDQRSN